MSDPSPVQPRPPPPPRRTLPAGTRVPALNTPLAPLRRHVTETARRHWLAQPPSPRPARAPAPSGHVRAESRDFREPVRKGHKQTNPGPHGGAGPGRAGLRPPLSAVSEGLGGSAGRWGDAGQREGRGSGAAGGPVGGGGAAGQGAAGREGERAGGVCSAGEGSGTGMVPAAPPLRSAAGGVWLPGPRESSGARGVSGPGAGLWGPGPGRRRGEGAAGTERGLSRELSALSPPASARQERPVPLQGKRVSQRAPGRGKRRPAGGARPLWVCGRRGCPGRDRRARQLLHSSAFRARSHLLPLRPV